MGRIWQLGSVFVQVFLSTLLLGNSLFANFVEARLGGEIN